MAARIAKLQQMTTSELREEWQLLMHEKPRSNNRQWLFKRLAWAMQAKEYGGLSERAQKRLDELLPYAPQWLPMPRGWSRNATPPNSSPTDRRRPPPGTVVTREYKGRTLVVAVLEDGFEYEGQRFKSLTAIAKAVTGAHWNGWHFFFGPKPKRKAG